MRARERRPSIRVRGYTGIKPAGKAEYTLAIKSGLAEMDRRNR
jgi:hypothetical protein